MGTQGGRGFNGLLTGFTVITKSSLPGWKALNLSREVKAAIDQTIALSAREFVGNSVSSFSAYILARRQKNYRPAWHYNGGNTPLQQGILQPLLLASIPTFAAPLKWVFAVVILPPIRKLVRFFVLVESCCFLNIHRG